MQIGRFQRTVAALLAITTVAMMVPAAALPTAAATTCQGFETVGYITLSHPLSDDLAASQVLYLLVAPQHALLQQNRETLNGIDAYVVDLGCTWQSAAFAAIGSDNGLGEYDLGVSFFSANLAPKGEFEDPNSQDVSGTVPDGSRYAVVYLTAGVPAAGLTPTFPTRPYSARVEFAIE